MTLTPRQIAAYLEFSEQLDRIERADALVIAAVGAQGDKNAIEKVLREITSDGKGSHQGHGR
jgi:CRISPR type IV-associated protein Csf3